MDSKPTDPNDPATFNRYVYANNNPYKFVDPDGRDVYNPSGYKVDPKTMENLQKLDKSTPNTDWWITSGVRSEEENSEADGATESRHLKKHGGDAADVAPSPKSGKGKVDMDDVAKKAGEAGFKGIITYKTEDGTSKNPYGGRLHLDRREESYSAEAKKNSNGGTVYKQKSSAKK